MRELAEMGALELGPLEAGASVALPQIGKAEATAEEEEAMLQLRSATTVTMEQDRPPSVRAETSEATACEKLNLEETLQSLFFSAEHACRPF